MIIYGLKILLHDGTEITTQDSFDSDELAIDQCTSYGKNGYYSRVRRVYYPPSSIKHISLITNEENKP